MSDIRQFDKLRRTHWRSDDDLKRIRKTFSWKAKRLTWGAVVLAFLAAAVLTQLGIWEYERVTARRAALLTTPADKVWRSCGEVRAAGVAPLFVDDPGYSYFLDADRDGVACEPSVGNRIGGMRWWLWKRF
jgi:Excalibur calcium-binding domain